MGGRFVDTSGHMLQEANPEPGLIERAKAGDAEAFGDLVKPHLSLFYNSIFRILGSPQDAEDALQEALILMHRDLPRFEGRSKFTSWAYPVCVNAALTLRRSRVSRREDAMEDLVPRDGGDGHGLDAEASLDWSVEAEALAIAERSEMRELVLKALDQLSDPLRVAFVLKDLEGWSTEAIAEHQGVSAVLLRQRLHRARLFLAERLRSHVLGSRPCR
jgi:RNA polymerase sigma-70 factor, ECF subfamily